MMPQLMISVRGLLVTTVAVALLLWGPVDNDAEYGRLYRIAYLVVVPSGLWLAIGAIWRTWNPTPTTETKISRAILAALGVTFLVVAGYEAMQTEHVGCSERVQVGDDAECPGDYVVLPGPDVSNVFLSMVLSAMSFMLSRGQGKESQTAPQTTYED